MIFLCTTTTFLGREIKLGAERMQRPETSCFVISYGTAHSIVYIQFVTSACTRMKYGHNHFYYIACARATNLQFFLKTISVQFHIFISIKKILYKKAAAVWRERETTCCCWEKKHQFFNCNVVRFFFFVFYSPLLSLYIKPYRNHF